MIEIRIDSESAWRWKRALLLMLGLALRAWLIYLVRDSWLPLIIALLIAMILDPLVDRMEQRGWNRLYSAILIYVAFFFVAGVSLTLAVPAIVSQTIEVTRSIEQYLPSTENETQTKKSLNKLLDKFHATPFIRTTVLRASAQFSRSSGNAAAWISRMATTMVSNLLWVVLIPIISFYALKDFHLIYARLLLMVPREQRSFAQHIINEITTILVRYLRGLMIVCALNGVATAIALALFKVPHTLALGAISGVLYSVPYLGPILTIAIIAGACLTGGMSTQITLIIVGVFILLHSVIFDQVITPRILGQHVGLHPILSIVALLVGGSLLGIPGMIFAVPVAATVQMILMVLFPKLSQPIDVPSGEQLHAQVDVIEQGQKTADEVETAVDVHQTIVNAVESAEEDVKTKQAQAEEAAPIVIPKTTKKVASG